MRYLRWCTISAPLGVMPTYSRGCANMKYFFALIFVSLSSSAMAARSSQGYGNGGQFAQFDPVVAEYNRSGELFRIVGHCQSACTLFLGIRNVCIEPGAQLLFHAGHDRQRNITAKSTNH